MPVGDHHENVRKEEGGNSRGAQKLEWRLQIMVTVCAETSAVIWPPSVLVLVIIRHCLNFRGRETHGETRSCSVS
jgi:hypothetical protein